MAWAENFVKRLYKGYKRADLCADRWDPTDNISYSSDEGQVYCSNQPLISTEDQQAIDVKEWRRALAFVPDKLSTAEWTEQHLLSKMEANPVSSEVSDSVWDYVRMTKQQIDLEIKGVNRVLSVLRGLKRGLYEKYLSPGVAKSYIERVSRVQRTQEMARDWLDNVAKVKKPRGLQRINASLSAKTIFPR